MQLRQATVIYRVEQDLSVLRTQRGPSFALGKERLTAPGAIFTLSPDPGAGPGILNRSLRQRPGRPFIVVAGRSNRSRESLETQVKSVVLPTKLLYDALCPARLQCHFGYCRA